MSSEVKQLSAKSKSVISRMGMKSPVISTGLHATMKADLALNWNQKRKLRRILKSVGISQESEQSERKFRNEKLSEHLQVSEITVEVMDVESPLSYSNLVGKYTYNVRTLYVQARTYGFGTDNIRNESFLDVRVRTYNVRT